MSFISDHFGACVIGTILAAEALVIGVKVHHDNVRDGKFYGEFQTAFAPVIKRYADSDKRLQSIIIHQGADLCTEPSQNCQYAAANYRELAGFKVSLSDRLPGDATIQVFKDRILINQYAPQHVQDESLTKVIAYIRGQKRDGVAYGDGECFTIGLGDLQKVGKNAYRNESLLLPAPGR